MRSIFLSYSSRDYFFAEMLAMKLDEKEFRLWRDQGAIRAGDDWRDTIEQGIKDSLAVVVALSESAAQSPYVTYEWAYAAGLGKPIVPVRLSPCTIHPRLEPTQYIDFSYPKVLPWEALFDRLKEIDVEVEAASVPDPAPIDPGISPAQLDAAAADVMAYLNSHGFTMASFERLQDRIGSHLTAEVFDALIARRSQMFRRARIKEGKPGIAKRVP